MTQVERRCAEAAYAQSIWGESPVETARKASLRELQNHPLWSGAIAAEEQGREAIVTDSERVADQMQRDILSGRVDKAGRQIVRDACDKMDAPKTGRDASDHAVGNIFRRG